MLPLAPTHLKPAFTWARRLLVVLTFVVALAACGSNAEPEIPTESSASTAVDGSRSTDGDQDGVDDHSHEAGDDGDQDGVDDHSHEAESETEDVVADNASETTLTTVGVANASYLGSYTLVDESFGTTVSVTVDGDTRTIESNTLPNHETGGFPNSGNPNTISAQDRSWTLTTNPVYTGQASATRETGVALNGVKFEPGTAESVQCDSGENYRIEGLQSMFDLGMDFNNAHVQPTGEYHYHGVSELLVSAFESDEDLVLVGFAADGHSMYYSKSSAYMSSYELSATTRSGTDCDYRGDTVAVANTTPDGTYVSDWVYTDDLGDLDECNGVMIGDEYAYLVTEEYPYIPRCLMGESTEAGPGGGGSGQGPGAGPGSGQGQGDAGQPPADGATGGQGVPDLTEAAAVLGVTAEELQGLLGGPPPDVAAAAETLGMTETELYDVLAANNAAPPSR